MWSRASFMSPKRVNARLCLTLGLAPSVLALALGYVGDGSFLPELADLLYMQSQVFAGEGGIETPPEPNECPVQSMESP